MDKKQNGLFGINFEDGDLSDPEIAQMLDASVEEHVHRQQAQQVAKQAAASKPPKKEPPALQLSAQGQLQCTSTGKNAYDTRHAALDAASHIEVERGITLGVYCCDECGKWHLTRRGNN